MSVKRAWLHVVGIGDDGLDSLHHATRGLVEDAEFIFGAERHHTLTQTLTAERRSWPSPFQALISDLRALEGKSVVVLATGDPLWYSVGSSLAQHFGTSEIMFHPQLSAFQLASARMGWSLAAVQTLTVHGRAPQTVLPFLAPEAKILLLTSDGETPMQIAQLLTENGFGASKMTALAHMGGVDELRVEGSANAWSDRVPDFHTLAVECRADAGVILQPRTALPDEAFISDGTMTKRDIRALSLAKLNPSQGALLWDLGCGAGSVAIEWMRSAKEARAIGIERRADRRAMAAQNGLALGAPALTLIDADLPSGLDDLSAPDAVFIGGGLTHETFATVWSALKPHGRLVANTVTLEGEAILFEIHKKLGGDLTKIALTHASQIGRLTGWRAAMPVTQLSLVKGG